MIMSVDAKLFVTVGKESFVDVVNAVVFELNGYVRDKLDTYWKSETDAVSRGHFLHNEDYKTQAEMFTNGVSISAYNMDIISIDFGNGDENRRSLKTFSNCSCDYSDTYDGDKIIFSIGHWGSCDEIMKHVGLACSEFGDVYYDHNDCDDEDFVKIY